MSHLIDDDDLDLTDALADAGVPVLRRRGHHGDVDDLLAGVRPAQRRRVRRLLEHGAEFRRIREVVPIRFVSEAGR